MEVEEVENVKNDPLLNNNSESLKNSSSDPNLTPSQSIASASIRHDFLFKIALLGNSGSGKTCLLKRFTDDSFIETPFLPTIGIDFRTKIIAVEDRSVKLQVWDTAGKSRFESLGEMFLSEAMGVVFCFDISDRKSFQNLPHWMNKFIGKPKKHNANPIPSFVVGCKSDLDEKKRMVTKYEAQAFAVKHGSRYMETSAKLDSGVNELFLALGSSILSHTLKTLKDISLSNNLPQKCSSEDSDEVLMRSDNNRRSLREFSNSVSKRARSLRRSFRVISYRKKKKEKKRKTSGDVSLAKADKEGNDETRALRASMRPSASIDIRSSISSNPSPEDEITCISAPTDENVIEDSDELNPKFKFCCM